MASALLLLPLSPPSPSPSPAKTKTFLHNIHVQPTPYPSHHYQRPHQFTTLALQETKEGADTAEEVTKKYGLEVGLWKIFSSNEGGGGKEKGKSKTDQAKELLTKYGGAYLATSITLSLISFSLCYLLVSAGIDVQALLGKVGIAANETGEKVGTFALAYAAHKAASPIRFPPTVALTPIVASWIGKKQVKEEEDK